MAKPFLGLNAEDHVLGVRWSVLLALLLVAMGLETLSPASTFIELASLALLLLSVAGALFVSAPVSTFRTICLGVSGIWFAAVIIGLTFAPFHGLVALLSALMLFASLIATFANLLKRESADLDSLLGGVYGYFLLAMVWAVLYAQIERWSPGAFAMPEGQDLSAGMIYFSFVTVTTLGYGDILPVAPAAQFAAGLQAAVGVLYVAVFIGSIVGTYRSSRHD